MQSRVRSLAASCLVLGFLLALMPAFASDHADPVTLTDPETNLTDLFFFPDGDNYVLIFDVRRNLTDAPPYDLKDDSFTVNIDLHSQVTYDNAADKARFGGTIVRPGEVGADATVHVRLNDDGSLKEAKIAGLAGQDAIRIWSGVRDDPFIFPPFFKKNTIATVMSIPKSSFPPGQQDFLLWATTAGKGKQVDHVGRSIRTQLPRYAALLGARDVNQLAPKDQVPAIDEIAKGREKVTNIINRYKQLAPVLPVWQTTLEMRAFDLMTPDVMVFTTRFPPGYPNGRLLTDDVVSLTCKVGDCLLVELAQRTGIWPQPTMNDKPFSPTFPYLADPWPSSPEPAPTAKSIWPLVIGIVLLLLLIFTVIPFWIGYRWGWKRCRRAEAAA
ncbi:MAG TPA: DUF4331 family protein [Thermoanaerobaculia bacterium]|jgi:hypothetical protein|nr:DUF4331 family protein [Thermoanaerobaculia bacterium]